MPVIKLIHTPAGPAPETKGQASSMLAATQVWCLAPGWQASASALAITDCCSLFSVLRSGGSTCCACNCLPQSCPLSSGSVWFPALVCMLWQLNCLLVAGE